MPLPQANNAVSRRTLLFALTGLLGIGGAAFYRQARTQSKHSAAEAPHSHSDSEAASAAMEAMETAIAPLAPPEKIAYLLPYQKDNDAKKRYAALELLAELKPSTLPVLLEAYLRDSHSSVRLHALELVLKLAPQDALFFLNRALSDEDTWAKQIALTQLAILRQQQPTLPYQNIMPTLIQSLDDTDTSIPLAAMHLLARLNNKNNQKAWGYRQTDTPETKKRVHDQWRQWARENPITLPPEFQQSTPFIQTREEPAPRFNLTATDGKPVTNATQQGRFTLINFWGTWCGACQSEIADLQRLHQETTIATNATNVEIVGVAFNEKDTASVQAFCQKKGMTYRQCLAPDTFLETWGEITGVPMSYLLTPSGNLCRAWSGDRDYTTFAQAIQNAQKAQK
jgi:thiol-disulfide isomerase/thioredoxin